MVNADSASPTASRPTRMARTHGAMFPGSIDGRVRESAPVPVRASDQSGSGGGSLFVGPDDPGTNAGYDFWFDTDEPVAGSV